MHEPAADSESRPRTPRVRARGRPRWRRLMGVLGAVMIFTGAVVGIAAIFAPEQTESASVSVVAAVRAGVHHAAAAANDGVPTVVLGGAGDAADIDACSGEFIGVQEYLGKPAGLQPTFAAHNGCGGDVILDWQLGQHVDVIAPAGDTVRHQVVDIRVVPQFGSTTVDIEGVGGALLLQTCFWVADDMRFVGLSPLA